MMRMPRTFLTLLAVLMLFVSVPASSQSSCFSKENFSKYQKIRAGQLVLGTLSAIEKKCMIKIHSVLSRSKAPKNSDECQDAWDQANSARDDTVSASKRLIRCVEGSDNRDDCYSEARRVRSNHDDFESAVSEVQSYCD
jgi:hypothetical protein